MGRNNNKRRKGGQRTQKRDFKKGGGGREGEAKRRRYDADPAQRAANTQASEAFVEYYKAQNIVGEADGEWDALVACMKTPLPASFRINGSGQFAAGVKAGFERRFSGLMGASADGEEGTNSYTDDAGERVVVPPPRALPWYPGGLAWQVNLSRHQLRRLPQFAELHEYIKRENEVGTITRQEAVSMIPPLLLDVQPHHNVLDMCAAPGSKTFQLLEKLHAGEGEPTGIVVANDVNVQRCHLLIHQTKRVNSANLLVTQHEAQSFPMVGRRWVEGRPDDSEAVRFDRVLCDVPCSGDGTIRKAPDIWRKWNVASANGLHRLQTRIAQRGARLLRVGGRLVYSTCSLNPIENEAVVAELLRSSKGALKLLDVSAELPELRRNPGVGEWRVKGRDRWYGTLADVDHDRDRMVSASFFPPKDYYDPDVYDEALAQAKAAAEEEANEKAEEAEDQAQQQQKRSPEDIAMETARAVAARQHAELPLPLERCMRLLPHHQDTGGFFVAVMEKVAEWPKDVRRKIGAKQAIAALRGEADPAELARVAAEEERRQAKESAEKDARIAAKRKAEEEEAAAAAAAEGGAGGAQEGAAAGAADGGKYKEKRQGHHKGIDPLIMYNDAAVNASIRAFYGLAEGAFPMESQLLVRSIGGLPKRIYYVSKPVADLIALNEKTHELKVVVVGVKMFERQEVKDGSVACAYRLAQEGLGWLEGVMTKQVLRLTLAEMHTMLATRSQPRHYFEGATGEALDALSKGCCVIRLRDGEALPEGTVAGAAPVSVPCWKGPASLNLLITSTDAHVILEQLGGKKESEPKVDKPAEAAATKVEVEGEGPAQAKAEGPAQAKAEGEGAPAPMEAEA